MPLAHPEVPAQSKSRRYQLYAARGATTAAAACTSASRYQRQLAQAGGEAVHVPAPAAPRRDGGIPRSPPGLCPRAMFEQFITSSSSPPHLLTSFSSPPPHLLTSFSSPHLLLLPVSSPLPPPHLPLTTSSPVAPPPCLPLNSPSPPPLRLLHLPCPRR